MDRPIHPMSVPPAPPPGAPELRWGQLYGAALPLAISGLARRHAGPVVVVAAAAAEADALEAELRFFAGDDLPVLRFPDLETLPYDVFSPHQDIVSRRLATLYRLPGLERGLLVIGVGTLLERLAPPDYVDAGTLLLRRGDRLVVEDMRRRLESAGYATVPQVVEHGEFAVRGSLLDVFPMGSDEPFRIDLFDDVIETIRGFDPDSQLSTGRREAVRVMPGREFPLTPEGIRGFRGRFRARFEGDPTRAQIYRDVSDGIAPGGIEYYLPLFFDRTATLFDYLPAASAWVSLGDGLAAARAAWAEINERYAQRAHDRERPILEPGEIGLPPEELEERLSRYGHIRADRFEIAEGTVPGPVLNFSSAAPPRLKLDNRSGEPARRLAEFLDGFDGRVLFVCESAGRRETLRDLLLAHDRSLPAVGGWQAFLDSGEPAAVTVAALEEGLRLDAAGLAVVSDQQLFGDRARQQARRRRSDRDPESIIRELTDLNPGSPVVHEEYGVGRYRGLETIEVGGIATEFLTLDYAGGDKLYVPVHALHLVTRYTGAAPEQAPLHRLGGEQWQRARARAAKRIRDVAAELLDLYARRAARPGHAFRIDERDYRAFCADFPFDETPDQQRAIDDVVADLRAREPMDRVVCGDVGFGKTEVALRAAFIAVQDGGQVALLVPTTLLAQQHHQTFRDRFADWPVRIELLSRFRSQKQSNAVLEGMRSGQVDIVIGTHKLLGSMVEFHNLGLVIVDEEHRFGVRHKERLKALKADVDTLTLTATPIPRTLNMALGGIKQMSLITTPPEERLTIKTFVTEWNGPLIREACLREIRRGGQVFFVHNNVQSIERVAAEVGALVPEARLRIAHGQMRERDLEQVMLDFYHRRFNVLVCTTIIESGIDIPTTNTIIINRADKLGLAQLHQLRGRVGRSHHRAYAYLFAPPVAAMTADAVKRLEAIESLEDLGAGFTLATHDLEIRGAGELLGEEQSGQIQEIGFSLYTELLGRAVEAMRSGREPDLTGPLEHGPEVDLGVSALLPGDYLPDVHMRLILYKRIASAADDEALRDLQIEMIDRFGLLPEPAKRLFRLTALKLAAAPLGIRRIKAGAAGGAIEFVAAPHVDPRCIIELVQAEPQTYRFDRAQRLRFGGALDQPGERFAAVERLLSRLSRAPVAEAG
ncbi:MAG TPA: transcription-repair coupling factor [Gammaproteobacteria bacterium]|nr:transcription-repair coupling factor [Gammaproteobacteria bacterium]